MDSVVDSCSDANWFSLEQSIKQGNVIPVIGPDALMIEIKDQTGAINELPFYQLLVEKLIAKYKVELAPEVLADTWVLHHAVTAILSNKSGAGIEQQIRRDLWHLANQHCSSVRSSESLRRLVEIRAFNLFVSLTPDNLLETLMKSYYGIEGVRVCTFSPREESESLVGPSLFQQDDHGVFQLLGSFSSINTFALHEEDTLEYLYKLQSSAPRSVSTLLSLLRRRDLLFIGCNFPDWLGRAILRLTNNDRLYSKNTQEFLCPKTKDASLTAFLYHYSPNTLGFEGRADDLTNKLAESVGGGTPLSISVSNQAEPLVGPTIFIVDPTFRTII